MAEVALNQFAEAFDLIAQSRPDVVLDIKRHAKIGRGNAVLALIRQFANASSRLRTPRRRACAVLPFIRRSEMLARKQGAQGLGRGVSAIAEATDTERLKWIAPA